MPGFVRQMLRLASGYDVAVMEIDGFTHPLSVVKLTKLTQEQADYIGVPVEGPHKPDFYRY